MWQTIIHTIFILSALGIAWTDKVMTGSRQQARAARALTARGGGGAGVRARHFEPLQRMPGHRRRRERSAITVARR